MRTHFPCKFCGAKFVSESRYLRHRCKEMIRDEEIRSPIGQAAWSFYQEWMKNQKRLVPSIQSFMKSNFYVSFIKFAAFVKKYAIPDSKLYIKVMIENGVDPTIWTNDEIYSIYIQYLDRQASATQQANITMKTLYNLSKAAECDISEIFDHLTHSEVIALLKQRRLSPWILIFSKKFNNFVQSASTEQNAIYFALIKQRFWQERFAKYPDDVKKMKEHVKMLGI